MNISTIIQKNSRTILTVVSVAGVAVTSVLASKSTIRAKEILDTKPNNLTTEEKVKLTWKCYIPAMVSGAVTIGSIIGINGISAKQIAALTGAYILMDKTYKENKDKIEEIIGEDTMKAVKKAIMTDKVKESDISESSDDTLLFYEEHYGQFFEKSMLEVQDAEYQLNRKLAIDGEATLNDFFEFLGLDKFKAADALGWSVEYICDCNHPAWIDFEHDLIETDDGLECYVITMIDQPVPNFA